MAKITGYMVAQKAPSLRGNVYVSTWRGIAILKKWPVKRKNVRPLVNQEQEDWFRQANILTKYIAPNMQITARNAVRGTPLYPRDVQVSLMAGRLIGLRFGPNEKLFGMAVKQQVSDSLDVITQTLGGILVRTGDIWDILPQGNLGEVLESQGPGAMPEFKPASGGGGGIWSEVAEMNAPAAGVFDFQGLDLSPYREVQIICTDLKPTISEGFFNLQIYDNGALVTTGYDWAYQAYSTSNFARTARATAAAALAVTGSGTNWGVNFTTGQGFSGTLTIADPDLAQDRLCYWNGTHQQVTGQTNGYRGAGKIDVVTKLDGIRISEPTNPIGSGKVKIVGLRKDASSPVPPPPGPANVLWKEIASMPAPVGGRFDLTGLDLTPYQTIKVQLTGIVPLTTTANPVLGVFVGGVLITSGYGYTNEAQADTGFSQRGSATSTGAILLPPGPNAWKVDTATGIGLNAEITINEPTSAVKKYGRFEGSYESTGGFTISINGAFKIPLGAAIDGISIYRIGGSLSTGMVQITGLLS